MSMLLSLYIIVSFQRYMIKIKTSNLSLFRLHTLVNLFHYIRNTDVSFQISKHTYSEEVVNLSIS